MRITVRGINAYMPENDKIRMKTVIITESIHAGTKKTIYEIDDCTYERVIAAIEDIPELADVDPACE